jgi:hypothetical protein
MAEIDGMMQMVGELGKLSVEAEAPADCPMPKVTMTFSPKTRADFLRCVDAIGGLEALDFIPKNKAGYRQCATAHSENLNVMIYEPERESPQPPITAHPFFGPLAERQERDAKRQAEQREFDEAAQAPA